LLNPSKGNMYDFVTHTWNTVKGKCPHGCTYCYMKRWGSLREIRFDKRELKTDLGEGNFIFVGSSCDLFAEAIPHDWIMSTLCKMNGYENRYLLQSKNPARFLLGYTGDVNRPVVFCTTIESNRFYRDIMNRSPAPEARADAMKKLSSFDRFVTIEPIMDFDLAPMVEMVKRCGPAQVNIGADSGRNGLPEPTADKVLALIDELSKFTTIARKTNLARLIGGE